ncbi:putative elongator complex protein 1 [Clonorchis sinensis]|uniref:Elongator complex protein 1 n=1 Tax=Clonorchis sinensis TaxID=79923 RepID=A0A8T1MMM3_CLOSI|nr:putative elongator complex protein 1 [Clonorchis sinensis]
MCGVRSIFSRQAHHCVCHTQVLHFYLLLTNPGDHCITLLTTSLEPILTADLNAQGFGTAAPIALGWGKKETQFHGSLGKQAALAKPEAPTSVVSVHDDGRYEVCWRDDGKYFVISYPDATLRNQRRLRIYAESGELFSTSHAVSNAEPGLCWRPRVQLVTTIQRRPGRGLDVIFFETNAERHGEFELLNASQESSFSVKQINFEEQGYILAALCTPLQSDGQSAFIRLITCSNYQWSIKRELHFGQVAVGADPPLPVTFTWGSVASHNGLFTLYVAAPAVSVSSESDSSMKGLLGTLVRSWVFCPMYDREYCLAGQPCNRVAATSSVSGIVCFVDNDCVKVTPMAHSVIPPPICSTQMVLKSRSLAGEYQPNRITSISFPGSWIARSPDSTHSPMIVQFESRSKELFTRLHLVDLQLGASNYRRQTFEDGEDAVDVQLVTGSQNVAPWPKRVRTIAISKIVSSINLTVQPVLDVLALANQLQSCGGNELTHLTWVDRTHVAFIACNGFLVGLLDLDDVTSTGMRWLLYAESSCKGSSRFCGLSWAPDGYLCVQLNSGHVIVYIFEELLRSKVCSVVLNIAQDNPDMRSLSSASSAEIHCILKFPVICDQLAVASFTTADLQRGALSAAPKVSSVVPYRSFLLGLHESSHRLYGAPIPTNPKVDQNADPAAHCKPVSLVMDLCSSFMVLPNFLLVTSMRKLLICIPTQFDAVTFASPESCQIELTSRLTIPTELYSTGQGASKNWYNDYLHPIETGAVLVTAVPTGTAVVLQMPRGNLEQVHPRALVLTHLADLLNSGNYTEALLLMRRHRVNMNLLHDHNPSTFRKNIGILLQQVEDPELLTLFISDLLEEDVSETMYGTFYGIANAQLYRDASVKQSLSSLRLRSPKANSKLNGICDLLLTYMTKDKRFLLPTLTCYAKKKPAELDAALLLLKNYYEAGDNFSWESGIRHLQYFATPNELYRVALGTYDLELAQVMAQRTQLDPKEYLVDLNYLRSIVSSDGGPWGDMQPEYRLAYQRFKIDDQLMRFPTALKHLRASGPQHSENLISYVEKHKLYEIALELFNENDAEFKVISRSWASHLLTGQKLLYAGQVYLRAGLYALAARAFLSAVQPYLWSISATEARHQHESGINQEDTDVVMSEQDIRDQALKMTARLKELGRHQEAIPLCVDSLKNPDAAILTALDGGLWLEARRLASTYTRPEVLKKWLKPKLSESASMLLERIERTHAEFSESFERLTQLRRRHADEAESRRIAQLHDNLDSAMDSATESDMFSDASSLSDASMSESVGDLSIRSNYTKISGRSAKNRRKQESRKWSSKPGSKYEEVGILRELSKSVELAQRLAAEVPILATELWHAGMSVDGRALIRSINQLLAEQKFAIPIIWDDWITEKDPQFYPVQQNEGRKRYPFKEPFISFPPAMSKTKVDCCLLGLGCS